MSTGTSKPLTASLFDHEEARKHGMSYVGPGELLAPRTRQNKPEIGNKNSRREHKHPSNQPKEPLMTTAHASKSTPNVNTNNGNHGPSAREMGDVFADVFEDGVTKHLSPAFDALAKGIRLNNDNQVEINKKLESMATAVGVAAGAAAGAQAAVEDLNKVTLKNLWGDVRQAGVIGGLAGVLGLGVWAFGAIFGSGETAPAAAPVRRVA